MQEPTDEHHTLEQMANALGLPVSAVRQMIVDGIAMTFESTSNTTCFSKSEFEAWQILHENICSDWRFIYRSEMTPMEIDYYKDFDRYDHGKPTSSDLLNKEVEFWQNASPEEWERAEARDQASEEWLRRQETQRNANIQKRISALPQAIQERIPAMREYLFRTLTATRTEREQRDIAGKRRHLSAISKRLDYVEWLKEHFEQYTEDQLFIDNNKYDLWWNNRNLTEWPEEDSSQYSEGAQEGDPGYSEGNSDWR